MQQRRLRLGDIVDDYCPRERRITNHAVVAMIEDQVKQTRCSTCDSDHEYKQARVPAQRRKKPDVPTLDGQSVEEIPRARGVAHGSSDTGDVLVDSGAERETENPVASVASAPAAAPDEPIEEAPGDRPEDEGPVHRPLIRATLPRPEGHVPERKLPDFTIRQPGRGSNFDQDGNIGRGQGRDQRGTARDRHSPSGGGQQRFAGPRQGGGGQRQNGPRPGAPGPNRQGRQGGGGHGQDQGQGQGQLGRGRRRGR